MKKSSKSGFFRYIYRPVVTRRHLEAMNDPCRLSLRRKVSDSVKYAMNVGCRYTELATRVRKRNRRGPRLVARLTVSIITAKLADSLINRQECKSKVQGCLSSLQSGLELVDEGLQVPRDRSQLEFQVPTAADAEFSRKPSDPEVEESPTLDGVTAAYLAHWRLSEKEKRASSRNDKKCMGSAFVPGKGQILQLDATKLLRNQQSDREVPRGGSKTAVACRVVFSDVICWSQCKF
ncbi:unnamed protein product [Nesidiocoris tenuis]|uniref:Uncharacterized protein n=1 Tax=Nesidiocoris tenuis TaxID=355587 RepID=A0A6H5H605_9HEMI|nr:unnamed protein product [Nesidiocoris tenuis]